MKKLKYISFGGVILLGIIYFFYWNYLPPRTPYKIARIQTGLNLSGSLKVKEFKDEWSFNGDGFILIVFELDFEQLEKIYNEIKIKKYQELPIDDRFRGTFLYKDGLLTEADIGYYKYKEFERGFTLTILNNTKKTLIVLKNIY